MKTINVLLMAALLAAAGLVPPARAVVTQKVTADTFAAFSGGEFTNISLTSDGHLELAPAMTNVASVTDPIIWAAVQDKKGNLYLGTGNQGKVYKLTPKGELSTFFEPNAVMVHALAIDGEDRLYAATSPNGCIYRLNADGSAEVYCNPGEAYVWAMVFGRDGSLFLATGNHGKILRVPRGSIPAKAETYFETKEDNITALALDNDGNLLAGSNPHGYLYRIDKRNHGFVLFNSGDKEIKQIAAAPDGVIYASTFVSDPKSDGGDDDNGDNGDPSQNGGGDGAKALGTIYRIATNGFCERYWSVPNEAIYSMTLLPDGTLLAGTGNKGRIYSIQDANHWKLLQATGDGAQVAALLPDTRESAWFYAATSQPANLYRLDLALATNGVWTSAVFNAKQKSQWGRLHPLGDLPDGTKLEFATHSGNTKKPNAMWSDWSKPMPLADEIAVASPEARYLQYRVEFKRDGGSPGATACLRCLEFYYQNINAPPVISRVAVHNEGFALTKMPIPDMDGQPANLSDLLGGDSDGAKPDGANPGAAMMAAMMAQPPLKMTKSPGYCTVVWKASDPNDDKLIYSVSIRAVSDKDWTKLADKTEDTFYSFNTAGFREGYYTIKVAASDLPSNTPETARTAKAVSEPFLINNAPPTLAVQSQSINDNTADIVVHAVDSASVITSAGYSLDGKEEMALRPVDLIFDSAAETFDIKLKGLSKGTHSLLVRAQDEVKNAGILQLNFEVK